MSSTTNVLFLAAEAEPFVKIGGLADVAGSLPLALRRLSARSAHGSKLDVRLVLPLHRLIDLSACVLKPVAEFTLVRQGEAIPVQVFETALDRLPVYFIDGGPITAASSVYSADLAADREKFAFFSLAALEMIPHLGWQPDILHANDWHTALALYALRSRPSKLLAHVRTVLTLHNLPYMGGDGADVLAAYGLPPLHDEALPPWAGTQPLPLGIWSADVLVPVSPTYAREILTPEFGCSLDGYLRGRSDSISGILNGLDTVCWNPETDKTLVANFKVGDFPNRVKNKLVLQKQLGLEEDASIPLLSMIGRIDYQKGVDIALEALPRLGDQPWQFVTLGSGDPALVEKIHQMQREYPDRVRAVIRFDSSLGRLIYAGADLFLMPSRYEPCGLAQMIAMRYGSVPVVRATGGLKDTVREGKTGFLFREADAGSMAEAFERALSTFNDPERWQSLQRNGMIKNFSWSRSARQYAAVYHSLLSFSQTSRQP